MTNYSLEVAAINERTAKTRYGEKKAYDLVAVDGTKYSWGFTHPSRAGITVGTKLSAQGEDGRFGITLDSKTAVVGAEVNVAASTTTPKTTSYSGRGEKVFPLPTTHGDTAIVRQNALTNAVATVADYVATQPTEKWPDLKTWREMVIETAYVFAEFSSGQREVKAVKAMQSVGMKATEIQSAVANHFGDDSDTAAEEAA